VKRKMSNFPLRRRTDPPLPPIDIKQAIKIINCMPAAKAVCLDLVISSKSMAYVMHYSDFPH
ncbi:hypothetical protein J2046_006848, partial [Rhizobium petrolearium]